MFARNAGASSAIFSFLIMSLMTSRQKPTYRFQKGDVIGAREAAELLGYKSPKKLQDADRRRNLIREFEAVGCSLTVERVGGEFRFLRSEIDEFLTRKFQKAQNARG